ncbi:hypothetical protein [Bacillus sp. JCM 19034]|uniref:hypothetical protein n=1 Tax=Bacillus sp. JCM 19034 TaxID=1481928 RepID=UPI0018D1B208|nr:hypothetical protein [Bacillus sp. JCM 19034]
MDGLCDWINWPFSLGDKGASKLGSAGRLANSTRNSNGQNQAPTPAITSSTTFGNIQSQLKNVQNQVDRRLETIREMAARLGLNQFQTSPLPVNVIYSQGLYRKLDDHNHVQFNRIDAEARGNGNNSRNDDKGIDNPLLPTEGKVGTFKELAKQGTAFDNITPHHMPSAAKMKQAGAKRSDGVSMNMEQPHPGVGGRHRETYTYGLSGNKLEEYLNLSYRDALTHDILDARRIYMKQGVYTPEIRAGLLNAIRKNRELYPELFNK